jgi:hypothetical protein
MVAFGESGMQIIPTEFVNGTDITVRMGDSVPHINWSLIITMTPFVIVFWLGLVAFLAAQTAFGSVKQIITSLKS